MKNVLSILFSLLLFQYAFAGDDIPLYRVGGKIAERGSGVAVYEMVDGKPVYKGTKGGTYISLFCTEDVDLQSCQNLVLAKFADEGDGKIPTSNSSRVIVLKREQRYSYSQIAAEVEEWRTIASDYIKGRDHERIGIYNWTKEYADKHLLGVILILPVLTVAIIETPFVPIEAVVEAIRVGKHHRATRRSAKRVNEVLSVLLDPNAASEIPSNDFFDMEVALQ